MKPTLALCERRFAAIAKLLECYPRPSGDAHGRLILDALEIAKASALEIKSSTDESSRDETTAAGVLNQNATRLNQT